MTKFVLLIALVFVSQFSLAQDQASNCEVQTQVNVIVDGVYGSADGLEDIVNGKINEKGYRISEKAETKIKVSVNTDFGLFKDTCNVVVEISKDDVILHIRTGQNSSRWGALECYSILDVLEEIPECQN